MTDHDDLLDELRRRADRVHAHTPEAATPPPGIWQQVLASTQLQPDEEEHPEMISQPILATPAGITRPGPESRTLSRFVNIAASLLVVAAAAMAGWFSVMNLDPGGSGNNGIAFAPGTPPAGAATCDVDPLTVDEVMEIVRNPYRYMAERADESVQGQRDYDQRIQIDLYEGELLPDQSAFRSANHTEVSDSQFSSAHEVADQYLACSLYGTFGQLWALVDPVWVQQFVLGGWPVFAGEADIRAEVENMIAREIRGFGVGIYSLLPEDVDVIWQANPDIAKASLVHLGDNTYGPIVAIGVVMTATDGTVLLETDAQGVPVQRSVSAPTQRPVIVVAKSAYSGNWYVLPWLHN